MEVDAQRFERLVADGTAARARGDHAQAGELLREALALWRGPALADLVDYRFAAAAAARLDDLRLAALADRVAADLALGHGDRLVPELEALCAEHPLHERLAAQLIAALAASGRQADALTAYERVRSLLSDELGVPPGPELQAAHMAVLQGEQAPRRRSNLSAPVDELRRARARDRPDRRAARARPARHAARPGRRGQDAARARGRRGLGRPRRRRRLDGRAGAGHRRGRHRARGARRARPARGRAARGAGGARRARAAARRARRPRDDPRARQLRAPDRGRRPSSPTGCSAGCPKLRLVATSREALAISGESLVAVPPLAQTPAQELFADRARGRAARAS